MSFASLCVLAVVPVVPLALKVAVCAGCAWSANETLKKFTARVPKKMKATETKERSWWLTVGKGEKGIERFNIAGSVPHLLVAGSTGGGKSIFEEWVLYTICSQQSPEWATVDIIDLKGGATFAHWASVPHVRKICGRIQEAEKVLADAAQLMWERLERIKIARAKFEEPPNFPHHFILIDEGSLLAKSDTAIEYFQELSAIGREPRVHLIYATQRPENTVLPLIIRDQLGARFCFKVDEPGTSEMMLGRDCLDAYELPNHPGRMVYRKANGTRVVVQAPYLDREKLMEWIKGWSTLEDKEEASAPCGPSSDFPEFTEEMEE